MYGVCQANSQFLATLGEMQAIRELVQKSQVLEEQVFSIYSKEAEEMR